VRLLVWGLLLLVSFVAAIPLSLRSAGVRRWVLAYASRSIEDATGIRARAADFELDWSGSLTLHEVTLAAGDAAPYLSADRVAADFVWEELRQTPPVLRGLEVERPRLDLGAAFPPAPAGPTVLGVDIRALSLHDFQILGATPAEESWLRAWSAEAVDLDGSIVADVVDAGVLSGRLRLERAEGPLDLDVRGHLGGGLDGPWQVDGLVVRGPGLALDADVDFGSGESSPLAARRFDLEVEPGRLLPELGEHGLVEAHGTLDLRTWTGRVRAKATAVPSPALSPWLGDVFELGETVDLDVDLVSDPAALPQVSGHAELTLETAERVVLAASAKLTDGRIDATTGVDVDSLAGRIEARADALPAVRLERWLGRELFDQIGAAGTTLDLTAEAELAIAAPERMRGRADLVWRRGPERLLTAKAHTLPGPASLAVEARLLPDAAGSRSVAGRIVAGSWSGLAEGTLADTRVELELPDLAAAVAEVHDHWPDLAVAGLSLAEIPLSGELVGYALLEGPVRRPRGELVATLADVDLATWSYGDTVLSGTVSANVDARGTFDDVSASVVVDGHGLRYGEDLAAEELYLEVDTDGRRLDRDDNYLRESILRSATKIVNGYQPLMPTYQGQIDEAGVLQLIAYIKTLNKGADAPAEGAAAGGAR